MLTSEEFLGHLHKALNHLYEPDRLRQSGLVGLFGIANRLDTFSTLQRILTEAIESLEPEADAPSPPYGWEIYEPLYYRYVQQLSQQQVAKQLGMSVRHLRRKEYAAVEVLADRLWKQFKLGGQSENDAQESAGQPIVAEDSPSVSEELSWLKDTLPESPADLNQILTEVMHLAEPLAVRHGVRLEILTTDVLPELPVHEIALSQALLNLLGVAIRQTTGGKASILAKPLPMGVEIQIRGTRSPVIAPPFSADDTASLELAQQLIILCGGGLTLHGDDEEVFNAVLTLPALEQILVLAIDDNADTLQLMRRYTAGTRYRLITSRESDKVLYLAEKAAPQIIVLDVMMPGVDGWKVLAQLRQHPLTEHIPVVVCTVMAQEEMAFALGASGFVRKPIARQAFLSMLDQQNRVAGYPGN
jgi:CheY-like chemotaxis protein/transcriptional regulator with XRE-family HTH domain